MKKTLSLDIQTNHLKDLDISGFFPIFEIATISSGILKPIVDQILPELPEISLYKVITLRPSEPFETLQTLDILHPDIFESSYWVRKFPEIINRKQKISITKPIKKPFGSLDIRTLSLIKSDKKYSDLFARNLSSWLWLRKFAKWSKFFYRRNKRILFALTATFFLVLVPTIFFIKFCVEAGYNNLLSLKDAQNITDIKRVIRQSRTNFERASFLFLPFSWIPLHTVDTVRSATEWGKYLAIALDTLTQKLPDSGSGVSLQIHENSENSMYRSKSKDIFLSENVGIPLPTEFLEQNKAAIDEAIDDIQKATNIFKNTSGNSSYDEKMQKVGYVLDKIVPIFQTYKQSSDVILTMLGDKNPQRYMIFNQNRDEIRANGGFPGSIISFTLYKGNILDYRTDDVYYYDWNLYPYKEVPPPGIALLTNNYGLRDVNYYPDFRETLEKANSFVERSGDSTLTTMIAIHQGLIENILSVVWPVHVDGVPVDFTDKNFSELMSILVENKFAKDKTPKDILFVFINAFAKKVVESKKIEQVADIVSDYFKNWEILIASRNKEVQQFLTSIQKPLPWNSGDKNWIYPVFTSVSGNKSDRYMHRSFETKIQKENNCSYKTEVILTQEHTYSKEDENTIIGFMDTFGLTDSQERAKMKFIQWDGENRVFIRYYMPKWTVLVGSGAEISEDENSMIFSFMLDTPVGGKSSKTLDFFQNIPNCSDYNNQISVYHQPGLREFLTP